MFRNLLLSSLVALLAGQLPSPARAQDDAPAPAPAETKSAVDLKLEDPAVRSVLAWKLTEPAEIVRAITVLVDLDRVELAKPLLAKLLDQNLKTKDLVALANSFGTPVFMKLASNPDLAPQGGQLADEVLSAAAKWRRDPKQIDSAIAHLVDPKDAVRRQAMHGLIAASDAAVGPLLKTLADPKRAALHPAALVVLAQLGPEAAGPLSAALNSGNEAIALAAVKVLGQSRSTSATADILALAYTGDPKSPLRMAASQSLAQILGHPVTADEAREFLLVDIERLLDEARKQRAVADATASTWRWDGKLASGARVGLPPADLAVETAGRYAQALKSVAQGLADQRLLVRAELTAAKYLSPDHPLPTGAGTARADAATFGSQVVEGVLIDALARGQTWAATAAVEVLGDVGSEALLDTAGAALSPLAEAARSNDRRLRFAAVDAILRIHPTEHFAGDSSVVDGLAFFAGTSGYRKALVGHPRPERAEDLAALLAEQGYRADVVTNSRQFLELASRSPDYELALVDVSLNSPPVDDLIGRLRRDPRTADLPIGVMTGDEMREPVERMAKGWPWVVAIGRMGDSHSLEFEISRIMASVGRDQLGHEARQAQAAASLAHLAELTHHRRGVFNVERVTPSVVRALNVPALTGGAALVLADLPDLAAQHALLDLANDTALPPATRKIGAVAFARNVRQFGLHLTSGEIQKQYDRYNSIRLHGRDVAEVMSSLLDAIEARAAGAESTESDE